MNFKCVNSVFYNKIIANLPVYTLECAAPTWSLKCPFYNKQPLVMVGNRNVWQTDTVPNGLLNREIPFSYAHVRIQVDVHVKIIIPDKRIAKNDVSYRAF